MPPKLVEHVVYRIKDGSFHCLHCGASYAMNLPVPIGIMLASMKEFRKAHKGCKPKKETQ